MRESAPPQGQAGERDGSSADADTGLPERYAAVQGRIAAAGGHDVTVIAVTKTFEASVIDAAVRCGIGDIGENYAQECAAKLGGITAEPRPRVHFIGRLQRNKVKRLACLVDVWQSVDRAVLVDEIACRAPGASVMVQVNIAGASSQGGCAPSEVESLASRVGETSLRLLGLMAIGPPGSSEGSRVCFRRLRRMADSLGLPHCSMGMSSDLEAAVEEGATMVRVGRGLFGPRQR